MRVIPMMRGRRRDRPSRTTLPGVRTRVVAGIGAALLAASAAGCDPSPDRAAPARRPGFVACTEPRPEICTMDYRPVCGLRDTGVRCVTAPCGSTEERTYSNDCNACSQADVLGFWPKACDTAGAGEESG